MSKKLTANDIIIKRQRAFYVYDENGNRYVDCSLNSGVSILGHSYRAMSNVLKQSISKGLWGLEQSRETERAKRNLDKYIDGFNIIAVLHIEKSFLLDTKKTPEILRDLGVTEVVDLLFEEDWKYKLESKKTKAILWRPFSGIEKKELEASEKNNGLEFVVTTCPISFGEPILFVFRKKEILSEKEKSDRRVFMNINNIALAGINYLIPHLIEKGTTNREIPKLAKNRDDIFVMDTHKKADKSYSELPLTRDWKRKGVYICLPDYSIEEYKKIRDVFFLHGFYFPEIDLAPCGEELHGKERVPRVIVTAPYMTKHELLQWEKALKSAEEIG